MPTLTVKSAQGLQVSVCLCFLLFNGNGIAEKDVRWSWPSPWCLWHVNIYGWHDLVGPRPSIRTSPVTHFLWFFRSKLLSPLSSEIFMRHIIFPKFFPPSEEIWRFSVRCVCAGYVALFRCLLGMVIKKLTFLSCVGSLNPCTTFLSIGRLSRPGIKHSDFFIFLRVLRISFGCGQGPPTCLFIGCAMGSGWLRLRGSVLATCWK